MEKACEFNVPLHMAFIDYKAFDLVWYSFLWTVLRGSVVRLLKNLYDGQQVRVKNDLIEWFTFKKSVCQGCIVSFMFFNFYFEELI